MFKKALTVAGLTALASATSMGTIVLSDSFNYTDGPLLGNGTPPWTITGTTTTNALGVVNGAVGLTTSGQDAYKAFDSAVTHTDGNSIYLGFKLNLTSAGSGDYFIHLGEVLGTTTAFDTRIFAKTTTGGFLLGINSTNGAAVYGTTVLSLATSYNVVVSWNFLAGTANDTFNIYVNPTSGVEGENTSYVSYIWNTGTEPASIVQVDLRQGTAGNAPAGAVDNIVVATTFSEGSSLPVPEPSTAVALCAGIGILTGFRRMRRPF